MEKGPDVLKDGVVRWRCMDLVRIAKERFGVTVSEDTMGRILHQLDFSHISARPRHPKQKDGEIESFEKFRKQLRARLKAFRSARQSRSGSRTRCGSARRTLACDNGQSAARAPAYPFLRDGVTAAIALQAACQ